MQPNWLAVMDRAQRRRPGIFAGRTMAAYPDTYVGLYHDVCGTLNGRRLKNGSLLYGCTCNLSVNLDRCSQDFDQSFPQVCIWAPTTIVPLSPHAAKFRRYRCRPAALRVGEANLHGCVRSIMPYCMSGI